MVKIKNLKANNMTKITVFNEKITDKKLKPIEFLYGIDTINCIFFEPLDIHKPSCYSEITVIRRNSFDALDLFICKANNGMFHKFLGNYNDGIV